MVEKYYHKKNRKVIVSGFAKNIIGQHVVEKRKGGAWVNNPDLYKDLNEHMQNQRILRWAGVPVVRAIPAYSKKGHVERLYLEKVRLLTEEDISQRIPEFIKIFRKLSEAELSYDVQAENFGIGKDGKLKVMDVSHIRGTEYEPQQDTFANSMSCLLFHCHMQSERNMPLTEHAVRRSIRIIEESKDAKLKEIASEWLKRAKRFVSR